MNPEQFRCCIQGGDIHICHWKKHLYKLILGRRILLMICESEDRLTGRVIIVVARTTDYCFLCNRKSFGISYCIKSWAGSHCGGNVDAAKASRRRRESCEAGFFLRQLGSFIPDSARHICVCSFLLIIT